MSEPKVPDRDGDDLAELYRRTPQPAAPAALGEELRRAARDAVKGAGRRAVFPWRQGVAVAVVAVLSVSIFLLLPRESLRSPVQAPMAPPAADAPARSAEPAGLTPPEPSEAAREQPAEETEAPQDAQPAATQPPAPAAAAPALKSRDATPEAADDPGSGAPAASAAARAVERSRLADEAGEADPLEESYYRSSPELWISHIERLLSEGRFDESKREFEAFRARYPRHPYAANQ